MNSLNLRIEELTENGGRCNLVKQAVTTPEHFAHGEWPDNGERSNLEQQVETTIPRGEAMPELILSKSTANKTLKGNTKASAIVPSTKGPVVIGDNTCLLCKRTFKTPTGVKIHQRSQHPVLYHAGNQPDARVKRRWSDEEYFMLAQAEVNAPKGVHMNKYLCGLFSSRSLEAIKGVRKSVKYRAKVQSLIQASIYSVEMKEAPAPVAMPEPELEWENNLKGSIDITMLASDIMVEEITCGSPDESCRNNIDKEYEIWISKWAKGKRTCPAKRIKTPHFRNKKHERRYQYAKIQNLYRKNRSRCANEVLSGAWREKEEEVTLKELAPFWEKLLGKESVQDSRRPSTKAGVKWDLIVPITVDEVQCALRSMGQSSPGPDGMSIDVLKSIPIGEIVTHYNLWLLAGYQPKCLRRGVTVLIPKIKSTRDPAKFRPITITDFMIRLFHKCLARRMDDVLPIGERQKAFRKCDGICHNIWAIRALIDDSKRNLKELNLVFLDVKKAFDSISHNSLILSAERMGVPPPLVTYIRELYSTATTQLKVGGEYSNPIRVQRGVRQGDPLSTHLFNAAIDWALSDLTEGIGVDVGNVKIGHLAFADDVVLVAATKAGLQKQICEFSDHIGLTGLEVSAGTEGKSASLRIVVDGKAKRWVVDPAMNFHVSGQTIPAMNISDSFKYLGVHLSAAGARGGSVNRMTEGLANLSSAPLKPQQRLYMLRAHLLPALTHALVLGSTTAKFLKFLDRCVRSAVRRWLRLPHDTVKAFFHSQTTDGGLGILSMQHSIPLLKINRLLKLEQSTDPVLKSISGLDLFRTMLHKYGSYRTSINRTQITDKNNLKSAMAQALHQSVDGRGLKRCPDVPTQSRWVESGTKLMSGRDFQGCIKVRGNLLPTKLRASRGRPLKDTGCDCCGGKRVESLGHILQVCQRTWGPRIDRHNTIMRLVIKQGEKKGFRHIAEPAIPTIEGLRRPDIVFYKKEMCYVVDVTIVADNADLDLAHERKQAYYNKPDIRKWITEQLPEVQKIHFAAVAANWRGCLSTTSADFLLSNMKMSKDFLSLISAVIAEKSYYIWCFFHKSTYRKQGATRRHQ